MPLMRAAVLVVSVALLLAACGSDAADEPVASPSDVVTPTRTTSASPSLPLDPAEAARVCPEKQPRSQSVAATLSLGEPTHATACLYDFDVPDDGDATTAGALALGRELVVPDVMTALRAAQGADQPKVCTKDAGKPGTIVLDYPNGGRRNVVLVRGGCGFIDQGRFLDSLHFPEANGPWFDVAPS